jgi:RimJ/RimL family protein N-acetyltransferase
MRNDPSTWINLTGIRHITPGDQEDWFDSLQSDKQREYFTALTESGEFLGMIRTDEIDTVNRSIRVGLDIAVDKRGQGWGTKVYTALLKWLFDYMGYHRVWLYTLTFNQPGLRLYRRVGFSVEGVMKESIWRDGAWWDCIIMSILEDEYRNGAKP